MNFAHSLAVVPQQERIFLVTICVGFLVIALLFSWLIRRWKMRRGVSDFERLIGGDPSTRARLQSFRHRQRLLRFRWLSRFGPRTSLISVVAVALLLGGFAIWEQPPQVSPGQPTTIEGRVTHVRDGDTIEVNGVPIRFADLDCAELGTQRGEDAKKRMRKLSAGKRVSCYLTGSRSYDRYIGQCELMDGTNLSRVMVDERYCFWWR